MHALGRTNTEPARRAFLARFEAEVDPEGRLPAEERAKRAEHALIEGVFPLACSEIRQVKEEESLSGLGPSGPRWLPPGRETRLLNLRNSRGVAQRS